MTFKEWLPVTPRNRVALVFAGFSLVLFVIWNFVPVPVYDPWKDLPDKMFGLYFWPSVFSVDPYLYAFNNLSFRAFMAVAVLICIVATSVTTILIIPFWKFCHAMTAIRVTVAILLMLGAGLLFLSLLEANGGKAILGSMGLVATSMTMNMMLISAALFIFENELARKPRKLDPRVPRSKPE